MRPPQWFKKLAIPLANKIVYASEAYVGLKSNINDMSSTLIDFSRPPAGPADERLLDFAELTRPWTYEGLELVRVGGDHDGGYIMANAFDVDGAISIGIGSDVSWDQSLVERGVPLTMFDHTVRRPPVKLTDVKFHSVGIMGSRNLRHCLPLSALLVKAEYSKDARLILKMDVEGEEWHVLDALDAEDLTTFSQIVMELHNLNSLANEREAEIILQGVRKLAQHHLPIWVHANNYDPLVKFDNYWFPKTVEIAYIKRDVADRASPSRLVTTALDAPCDRRVSEISLQGLASLTNSSGAAEPNTSGDVTAERS